MKIPSRQADLFNRNDFNNDNSPCQGELGISSASLKDWQRKIYNYQSNLFNSSANNYVQGSLFRFNDSSPVFTFNPLDLTPLPLSFWRWPESPHHGPSIYLVMDLLDSENKNLILYIGETLSADKRWKGEHDCKSYLSAYSEALSIAGLRSCLSIRFWTDVPKGTKERRKLEQLLIQHWLPPFNKENQGRWATPFTKLEK